MPDRTYSTPEEIMGAIVTRLRSQLGIDASACYWVINPQETSRRSGDLTYVVSPTSGRFLESMFEGGGVDQLTVEWGVDVTIHSPILLDAAKQAEKFLADENRGLFIAAANVIKALAGWEPGDNDRIYLRDTMSPSDFSFMKTDAKGSMTIGFTCRFDWGLPA